MNLAAADAARLLTRTGVLTTKLGSKRQVEGWQDFFKGLMSRGAELAEASGDVDCWAEARESWQCVIGAKGAFDEARLTILICSNEVEQVIGALAATDGCGIGRAQFRPILKRRWRLLFHSKHCRTSIRFLAGTVP